MTTSLEEIKKLKNYGKYEEGLDLVKLLLKQPDLENNLEFEAEKLQVQLLNRINNYQESLKLCEKILKKREKDKNKSKFAYVLLQKSFTLLHLSLQDFNYDNFLKEFNYAEKIINEEKEADTSDYKELMMFFSYIKSYYLFYTDKQIEALKLLEQSLELFEEGLKEEDLCETLSQLCIYCFWTGEVDKGIKYGEKALRVFEEYENPLLKSDVLFSLSMIYTIKGKFELALEIRHECTAIRKEHNSEFGVHESNLTEAWQQTYVGNWEKAKQLFSESLEYMKEVGSIWWSFFGYNFLSLIYLETGETEKALEKGLESLEMAEKINKENLKAMAYRAIAYSYHRLSQTDNALEYYLKALETFQRIGGPLHGAHIISSIIDIYVENNNLNQAKEYFEMLKQIDEKVDMKTVHHKRQLSEALIFMKSSEVRERGKAELLFEQLIEEKEIQFYLRINSLFNMCVLLVTEFQLSGDTKIFERLNKYLKELLDIAEEKNLYYFIVEIYILQSKIASINMEVSEAEELLRKAQKLAEKNKLDELTTKVLGEQDLLQKQLDAWRELMKQEAPTLERIKDVRIDESIRSMKKQITSNLFEDSGDDPATINKLFSLKI